MPSILAQLGELGKYVTDQGRIFIQNARADLARNADQQQLYGPIVPVDCKLGHQVVLPLSIMALGYEISKSPASGSGATMATLTALGYIRKGGYRLWDIGVNPKLIWEQGEWQRLLTAPLIPTSWWEQQWDLRLLASAALDIEHRHGYKTLAGILAFIGIASSGIYLCATKIAALLFPKSILAAEYYLSYAIGPGAIVVGLDVFDGYDRDVSVSDEKLWISRYKWGLSVLLLITAARFEPNALPPSAAMLASGVASGVLATYCFGYLWAPRMWTKAAGLGWTDLGIQMGLLALWVGAFCC